MLGSVALLRDMIEPGGDHGLAPSSRSTSGMPSGA